MTDRAAFGVWPTQVNNGKTAALLREERVLNTNQLKETAMYFECRNFRNASIVALLAGLSLIPVLAQDNTSKVASGHREILLEATKSWNGTPYTHYPTGQP